MTNNSSRADGCPPEPATRRECGRLVGSPNATPRVARRLIVTDGGLTDGDGATDDGAELATHTNEEYGYSIDYPASWAVDTDRRGGATFEDTTSTAGAVVSVDENVGADVAAYAGRFQESIAADEDIHDLTLLDQRTARLSSGHQGQVIECAYVGEAPDDRWRLTYLFVVADDTGYTVGIDWDADADFEAIARTTIESFRLTTNRTE